LRWLPESGSSFVRVRRCRLDATPIWGTWLIAASVSWSSASIGNELFQKNLQDAEGIRIILTTKKKNDL
jgi:hypothetical protein